MLHEDYGGVVARQCSEINVELLRDTHVADSVRSVWIARFKVKILACIALIASVLLTVEVYFRLDFFNQSAGESALISSVTLLLSTIYSIFSYFVFIGTFVSLEIYTVYKMHSEENTNGNNGMIKDKKSSICNALCSILLNCLLRLPELVAPVMVFVFVIDVG
jgi:hypothetical protein